MRIQFNNIRISSEHFYLNIPMKPTPRRLQCNIHVPYMA